MKNLIIFLLSSLIYYLLLRSKDRFASREAFAYGILSAALALFISQAINTERIWGFQETIEELAKLIAMLIFWRLCPVASMQDKILAGGMLGFGFAFAESGAYAFFVGNTGLLFYRILFTNVLHVTAGICMAYYGGYSRILMILVPTIMHTFFNLTVATGNILVVAVYTGIIIRFAVHKIMRAKENDRITQTIFSFEQEGNPGNGSEDLN